MLMFSFIAEATLIGARMFACDSSKVNVRQDLLSPVYKEQGQNEGLENTSPVAQASISIRWQWVVPCEARALCGGAVGSWHFQNTTERLACVTVRTRRCVSSSDVDGCYTCFIVCSAVGLWLLGREVRSNSCCFHRVLAPHALTTTELTSRGGQAARRELKAQPVLQDL